MSEHLEPAPPSAASSPAEPGTPFRPVRGRRIGRVLIPLLLAVTVLIVYVAKPSREVVPPATPPVQDSAPMVSHGTAVQAAGLPRLLDLGADRCIPCKAMAPILVELRSTYAGRLQVDFIDVWKDPSAGDPYNIYAIPTQIFFDGTGKELTRHEGFLSREDILATWKQFGYDLNSPGRPAPRT